jgi:hypothetical protein
LVEDQLQGTIAPSQTTLPHPDDRGDGSDLIGSISGAIEQVKVELQ